MISHSNKTHNHSIPLLKVVNGHPVTTTINDVSLGEYIYDRNGHHTKVLAICSKRNVDAYRVTLTDGRSFIGSHEQLIPHYQWNNANKIKVKPLSDMVNDYLSGKQKQKKYQIPQNNAIEFPEKHHTIHPYVLGVLLGSGSLTSHTLGVTISQQDVVAKMARLLDIPDSCVTIMYRDETQRQFQTSFVHHDNAERARVELQRLGLRGTLGEDRFIPKSYLYDSKENRINLLKGLMDSNGYIRKNGKSSSVCRYKTTSSRLISDIKSLVLSLGFGFSIHKETSDLPNHYHQPYILTIFTPECITSSNHHAHTIGTRTYRGKRHLYTSIVNIEKVAPRDMVLFTVDDEHLFLMNDYIVAHSAPTIERKQEKGNDKDDIPTETN